MFHSLLLALNALIIGASPLTPAAQPEGYLVQVVLQVDGLDDEDLVRLAREVAKEGSTAIAYSCSRSGVIVLEYANAVTDDRADAITMVRRTLSSAGISKSMEVLHVHARSSGEGKC